MEVTRDSITWKRKHLEDCTLEELCQAAGCATKRLIAISSIIKQYLKMASMFCQVLPNKDHSRSLQAVEDSEKELCELQDMAKIIKQEIEIRIQGTTDGKTKTQTDNN